jgi:hypothetical protein
MALLLNNSVFIHTPKTAGQWVTEAITNSGISVEQIGVIHTSPDEIKSDPRIKNIHHMFTFVRHPLTWYQSMWSHQMDEGWDAIDAIEWFSQPWMEKWKPFTECRSYNFQKFVKNCLNCFPDGWVSSLYKAYTNGCTFIGRHENIVNDLERALFAAGEICSIEKLQETKPRNVRGAWRRRSGEVYYSQELVEQVMNVERYAVETFGYREIPNSIIEKLL